MREKADLFAGIIGITFVLLVVLFSYFFISTYGEGEKFQTVYSMAGVFAFFIGGIVLISTVYFILIRRNRIEGKNRKLYK